MNFFSSDAFLESLIEVHFQGRKCDIGDYRVGDQVFRLLSVDGRVISDWPFLDFFEAREPHEAGEGKPKSLGFLPRAVVGLLPAKGEKPAEVAPHQHVSPLVDWRPIPDWAAFQEHVKERRSTLFRDSAKRERKLEAEVGPVSFSYHEPSDEIFELCRGWKSAQYISTGGTDKFFRDNLAVFQCLRRRGLLVMHVLRAGKAPVAITWSAFHAGRLSYWVSAYDNRYGAYSPGRLLMHRVMEEGRRQGHTEFDMLIGSEEYKWHYASHTRVVASVGQPPWTMTLKKELKSRVKEALGRYPKALEVAREWKKRLER
jgi:hypothetical protein